MEFLILGTLLGAWLSDRRRSRSQHHAVPGPGQDEYGKSGRVVGAVKQAARTAEPYMRSAGSAALSSGISIGQGSSGLGDSTMIQKPGTASPLGVGGGGEGICSTWIEYLRLYHPSDFSRDMYTVYENASADLGDHCSSDLNRMLKRDAAKRSIRPSELLSEFKSRLKADGKAFRK